MTVATLAVDSVKPQPWRNGGGVTRELVTWPSAQAWGIRISVADVGRDGPFSAFEGVDRWLVVLDGAGVALRFEDSGETVRIAPGEAPFRFDGGRPVSCTLVDGPTRDLNVMVARKRGEGRCEPMRPGEAWSTRADFRAVFARHAARLVHGEGTLDVAAMALAWAAGPRHDGWRIDEPAHAWRIDYRAKGRR